MSKFILTFAFLAFQSIVSTLSFSMCSSEISSPIQAASSTRSVTGLVCSAQPDYREARSLTRRNVLASALVAFSLPVNAEDVLRIPESERIKPPAGMRRVLN